MKHGPMACLSDVCGGVCVCFLKGCFLSDGCVCIAAAVLIPARCVCGCLRDVSVCVCLILYAHTSPATILLT